MVSTAENKFLACCECSWSLKLILIVTAALNIVEIYIKKTVHFLWSNFATFACQLCGHEGNMNLCEKHELSNFFVYKCLQDQTWKRSSVRIHWGRSSVQLHFNTKNCNTEVLVMFLLF